MPRWLKCVTLRVPHKLPCALGVCTVCVFSCLSRGVVYPLVSKPEPVHRSKSTACALPSPLTAKSTLPLPTGTCLTNIGVIL